MTQHTAKLVGVPDSAAGAGVAEYFGMQGPLPGLLEAAAIIPAGDPWQIKGSLSFTPTLITDTLPPSPILAWKVPSGRALLWTGGVYHNLAAATEYLRVCRRFFLYGWQATAAPAAPAAPTVALVALTSGIGTAGAYTYKVAPFDTFHRESAATAASASVTLTGTSQGVTVTPPALPTGAVGYNIYRTLAGGALYYYVGSTLGAAAYTDAQPDAAIDTALVPSATWATGAITGETMDGPGEIIIEVGAIALTAAPTTLVYKGAYAQQQQALAVTWPTTIGARLRAKLSGEAANFVAVPTLAANLWRGPYTADVRTRHEHDLGATAVLGVNAGPSAGSFIVWGQQVIGTSDRQEATAAIRSSRLIPVHPNGILLPELSEIVCEVGALATGVAGVRDVSMYGALLPSTAS
jgi:hypothetical protein